MNVTSNCDQVSIAADPTLPIICITRGCCATPAQLMRAHTDPELFARWVGPNGCFHEVSEDRIVQTFTFDGQPDRVALETLRFDDRGDGRTRRRVQSLVDSFEGRDQWLASGTNTGIEEGYAKLDIVSAELR
jgi:uncharacterized protein YndB with AHSA1/START domain